MLAGFADPVLDAQGCFRAALDALSRPGRVLRMAAAPPAPSPLVPAAAALLLAVCDAETSVCLLDAEPAREWLRFHTGCPEAPLGSARFVLAAGAMPGLAALDPGTDEAPQDSATLILQVAALEEGAGMRLRGPGIERDHLLHASGLAPGFRTSWAANRARFPRGVDLFLCCGHRLAAIPRGTEIA